MKAIARIIAVLLGLLAAWNTKQLSDRASTQDVGAGHYAAYAGAPAAGAGVLWLLSPLAGLLVKPKGPTVASVTEQETAVLELVRASMRDAQMADVACIAVKLLAGKVKS